jgi:hypothetical protein
LALIKLSHHVRHDVREAMSFARPPLGLGFSPGLRVFSAQYSHRSLSAARCSFSTSTFLRRAEPSHNSGHKHAPPHSSPLTGASSTKIDHKDDENPYKDGPSAIDKAVHLFFFTEILRGNHDNADRGSLIIRSKRHVDCHREFLSSTIHYQVSV